MIAAFYIGPEALKATGISVASSQILVGAVSWYNGNRTAESFFGGMGDPVDLRNAALIGLSGYQVAELGVDSGLISRADVNSVGFLANYLSSLSAIEHARTSKEDRIIWGIGLIYAPAIFF